MYLHTPALEAGSWWRIDTASGSDTATTVYAHDGTDAIPTSLGTSGSTVRGNTRDGTAVFWSATATLYCKELTYQGVPTGTVVTSTGGTPAAPGPAAPVDIATISTLVAALPTTYVKLLVTDATSTAASGTLVAGHLTPINATGGAATWTLPAASSVVAGTPTVAKKADTSANAVTVQRAGSDLVFGTGSGATSKTLSLAGEAVTFISNGVDRWSIESSDTPSGSLAGTYLTQTAATGTYAQVVALTGAGIDTSGATDSTTAINALLSANAGKVVRGVPGANYATSAPLVVKSGTVLDMTSCIVTLTAPSAACNMLNNAAVTAQRTVTDAAITSGTNSLSSATASFTSADTGRTVAVAGAATGGYTLVATMTYSSATTVTLSLNAGATVSGASASIYTRDTNIEIRGGTWVRSTAGAAAANTDLHSLRFRHIDGLTIRDLNVTTANGKFAINPGDVTRLRVININLSSFSDGVHVNGPASSIHIEDIFGTTGDDTVAITPNDWPGYNDTVGDITDVTIENVYPVSTAAIVKILGGSPATAAKRIRIRNVSGTGGNNGLFLGDDWSQAGTTGGLVDALTVENVSVTVPNGQRAVWMSGSNMKRVTLKNIGFDNASASAPIIEFSPTSSATLSSLVIDGVSVASMAASPVVQVASTGTVTRMVYDRLTVDSCTSGASGLWVNGAITDLAMRGAAVNFTGSSNLVGLSSSSGTITRATLADCHVTGSGGNLIVATASTHVLPNVEVNGCSVTGTAWLVDLNTTTELHLSGVTLKSPTQGIANLRANSFVTFTGDGNSLAAGSQGIKVTSGGKAIVRAIDIPPSTTAGGFPTIAAGAGLGSSPTVAVAGSDRTGTLTLTPGSGAAAGAQATVTFMGTWSQTPKIQFAETNAAAQAAGAYLSAKSTTAFTLSTANTPSGAMTFDYVVLA